NPLYWQGVIYDITERKQAEERLREAEERYRTLVEQLPVAIYTDATDDLSTALYISPQYERLTGYTPEQRLMDPGLWVRMLHPDDRERVLAESKRTNGSGDPFDVEYRVVRADGTITWLHDHAMVVAGPDGERAAEANRINYVKGGALDVENRVTAKDGTVWWLPDQASIVRDEDGRQRFSHGFLIGVGERKAAEQAMHDAERRYRSLIETL